MSNERKLPDPQENKMGVMPIGKLLVNMATPMIISMIVQALYNVVDSIYQSVKYEIKDKIVEYLTPYISECDTLNKAENLLVSNLKGIEKVADKHLELRGFNYSSKADVRTEEFPTRTYDELTLSAGKYRALIVTLGDGKGDNWWCVVYPPLCFVGNGTRYEYKSKILEIINQFKRNYEEEQ